MSDQYDLIAALGRVTAHVSRHAEELRGGPSRTAAIRIETTMERPASIGGGTVGWTLWADPGGNSDWIPHLNALLSLVATAIEDSGFTAAVRRNIALDLAAARAQRDEARRRLRATYAPDAHATRGPFLVQRDEHRGGVWLLDPGKRGEGFGFWFVSLSDLWERHPSLRPVGWDGGDLLVAPWVPAATDTAMEVEHGE